MSQPIILWKGKDIIVDGHTRYYAAIKAGIQEVHTFLKDFNDEDAALHYAITQQANRRNLTDAEIIRCIEALDRRRQRGGDHGNQYTGGKVAKAPNGAFAKTCEETAQTIGISPRKVERARTVLDHADPETREAVKEGKKSINRAYQETQAKRKAARTPEPSEPETGSGPEPEPPKPDPRTEKLQQAIAELTVWREKYPNFVELSPVYEFLDSYQPCPVRLVKG
ncbi:MAG: hypothetical protein BZ151_12030 [Desulfobacca sp. 4484_104]|nr:MAG: hypothetical protein BZ151_12030 [Desulfobacca sp. 4484_104]